MIYLSLKPIPATKLFIYTTLLCCSFVILLISSGEWPGIYSYGHWVLPICRAGCECSSELIQFHSHSRSSETRRRRRRWSRSMRMRKRRMRRSQSSSRSSGQSQRDCGSNELDSSSAIRLHLSWSRVQRRDLSPTKCRNMPATVCVLEHACWNLRVTTFVLHPACWNMSAAYAISTFIKIGAGWLPAKRR